MSTRLPILLVLGAATILVAGCQTTINSTEHAEPAGQRNLVAEKRLITDSSLSRKVNIWAVNEQVGPGGLLTVQVELVNNTRSLQSFSYKFEWFDQQGMEVSGPATVFVPKQIEGKERIFVRGTAPNEQAKDFRLKLIETN
jgi:uncharacterized protein YcfL